MSKEVFTQDTIHSVTEPSELTEQGVTYLVSI